MNLEPRTISGPRTPPPGRQEGQSMAKKSYCHEEDGSRAPDCARIVQLPLWYVWETGQKSRSGACGPGACGACGPDNAHSRRQRRQRGRAQAGSAVMPRTTPKLPFAFLRAGDPQLTISDNDWQRIENAYGQSLSARHSRYCDVDASCFKTLLDFFWPPP